MKSRFIPRPVARVIGGIFLALLIMGVPVTAAATLVVDRDGLAAIGNCAALTPADSPTISGAVAMAAPGSTITVCPGPYFEPFLVISKPLTLKGAQAGNTFVGRLTPFPLESLVVGSITIQAPYVTIDGFWLSTLSTQGIMILVKTAGDDAGVTNNVIDTVGRDPVSIFSGNSAAIYLEHGPDRVKVVRNRISNVASQITAQGILIGDSTAANPSLNILLSGNLIEDIESVTRGAYGIQVNNGASTDPAASGFTTVAIRDNTIDDLKGGGWAHAIGLEGPTPNAEVVRNSISDVDDLTPALDIGQDAAAVFFEANPYFPTVEVHFNNFDVTMAAYGIALHPALIASDGYRGKVHGSCNWWDAADGPGPVGPGSGAKVTPKVHFDPWLDAPAPGGTCRHECHGEHDDPDHTHGYDDKYDGKLIRHLERSFSGTVAGGAYDAFMLASDGGGLPLLARVESPNAQFLVVEIYDPAGRLVAPSLPTPGTAVATVPGLLPGIYPVRVRSIGVLPIEYTIKLITTVPWF